MFYCYYDTLAHLWYNILCVATILSFWQIILDARSIINLCDVNYDKNFTDE